MANREWFITKLAGSVMGILLLISMGVTVANLHFDLKRDVDRIDVDLTDHKVSDDKKWDKADVNNIKINDSIESIKEKSHSLELVIREQTIQYSYIQAELNEIKLILKTFEVK